MVYPCVKFAQSALIKFGNFSFSHFDFIVRTHRQDRITKEDERCTHATTGTVGVSKYNSLSTTIATAAAAADFV